MDVVLVQAGVVAVALELDLELHLGHSHRQVADRAWRADARTTPRAVWGAARELAALDHRARLLAKSLFFHLAVPRMFGAKGRARCHGDRSRDPWKAHPVYRRSFDRDTRDQRPRYFYDGLIVQHHPQKRLGGAQAPARALLARPAADHRRRIPIAHLATVLAERPHLRVERAGDVDERLGELRAEQPDGADVMRREPLVQQLGADEARLRRRADRVARDVGGHALVREVPVA